MKTVAQLIEELRDYPADAEVTRFDISVQTPTVKSKLFYSNRRKTQEPA
jgi:hypothetical protein